MQHTESETMQTNIETLTSSWFPSEFVLSDSDRITNDYDNTSNSYEWYVKLMNLQGSQALNVFIMHADAYK